MFIWNWLLRCQEYIFTGKIELRRFLMIAAAMLLLLYKNVKVIGTLAMVVAMIALVKGLAYLYFGVVDPGRHGM